MQIIVIVYSQLYYSILFLKNDSQLNLGSFHRSASAFTNVFSYIFIYLFH